MTGNERTTIPLSTRAATVTRSLLAKQEAGIIIAFFVLVAFFYSRNSAMLDPATVGSILRTMAFPVPDRHGHGATDDLQAKSTSPPGQ